jgi:hypothetical protein
LPQTRRPRRGVPWLTFLAFVVAFVVAIIVVFRVLHSDLHSQASHSHLRDTQQAMNNARFEATASCLHGVLDLVITPATKHETPGQVRRLIEIDCAALLNH